MCGITGIYTLNDSNINKDLLLRMNNKIRHRGPDDEGYFISNTQEGVFNFASGEETQKELKASLLPLDNSHSGNLGLGFRRLSIQDLSIKGHQPMTDLKDRVVIVFNGEIYNFIELRGELKTKGYSFNSLTDTEVILNAYLEWGEDCVHHFNGMWAFALWDMEKEKLFCSRDRFGIKPFYYTFQNNQFVFASEIKALLESVPAKINKDTLYKYLYYDEMDTSNDTFFEGVSQLPAGYTLSILKEEITLKCYYSIEKEVTSIEKSSPVDFFNNLQKATILRLRSDVKVGFALSGGVDSSSIVAMAHDISGKDKKETFSIVYPGTEIDESPYIDAVIEKIHFNNHRISPTADEFMSDLQDFIYHQEEPVPGLSYYNEYNLRNFIKRKKVVVTLEGQGADEIVTGYRSFVLPFYFDLIDSFQWSKLRKEKKMFDHLYPIKFSQILLRYMASKLPIIFFQFLKRGSKISNEKSINSSYFRFKPSPTKQKHKGNNLNKALLNSIKLFSIPMQLNRADKSSMAFSLECRYPFLDHKLVEYALGLPNHMKMENGITKKILREAMQNHIPKKVSERRDKNGFISPQTKWIQDLSPFFDTLVYSDVFKNCPYIVWDSFEKKYSALKKNKIVDSKEIWKIIGVFLWEQRFINKQ